jgi:hypothetical protein
MGRFHQGAFRLAGELKADLLPVVIHGSANCLPKRDFQFREGELTVALLPRIPPHESRYGVTPREKARALRALMSDELEAMKAAYENGAYHRHALVRNYLYKGPDLLRSLRRELKRYRHYDPLLPLLPRRGRICELGCGYGFLSYMMWLTAGTRQIDAYDADEEKINVARRCTLASEAVRFHQGFRMGAETPPEAVVVRNAFSEGNESAATLVTWYAALPPGGLFVLDHRFTVQMAEICRKLSAATGLEAKGEVKHSWLVIRKTSH